LVDHGQRQVFELDGLLEKRMGADDDVRFSKRDAPESFVALFSFFTSSKNLYSCVSLRQPTESCKMLPGQDLGWDHECALRAGFYRRCQREKRNDRLSGSDIALEQPQHSLGRGHVP